MTGRWLQHEMSSYEGFSPLIDGKYPCSQDVRKHVTDCVRPEFSSLGSQSRESLPVAGTLWELAFEPDPEG